MSILIQNVLLNGKRTDILIEKNIIRKICPGVAGDFDTVIDGTRFAAVPPFYNAHGHAAMTLLRGLADDLELYEWLNKHIWPAEAKLTKEDIYWGTKLACMEMIRSGTVFFNDMYFLPMETIRAVEETGIRAAVGLIMLEADPEAKKRFTVDNDAILERRKDFSSRIQLAYAPHAIYTVTEDSWRKIAVDAEKNDLMIHTHLAETEQEVKDCFSAHGCSPVEYLDRLGLLSEKMLAAHSIHLSDSDIEIIYNRRANLAYNPCSNAKLHSGHFHFRKLHERGIRVCLGTDSCASNNNLSMFDEMKTAAFNAVLDNGGPVPGNAELVYMAATRNGAETFRINAGVIEEGRLADIVLIDLYSTMMVADHNLVSNLVYSADSSCVSTVICDGRILMRDRVIPGYDETIENARRCASRLAE